MDTRKLRHAVVLARVRNFTLAAKELHLTQSALSRSIQSLEADCELALFQRGRGAVTLTQAGAEFIRRAEDLVRSEAAFRSFASDVSRGTGGRINLGVTPIASRVLLAPLLAPHLGSPNLHVEVTVASTGRLLELVRRQVIDVAIGLGDMPGTEPSLSAVHLTSLRLAVVVRADHPLTRNEIVTEDAFQRYPLVRSASYSLEVSLPVLLGLTRNHAPTVTIEDFHVLERLVEASDAVWITAPVAVADGIARGALAALPLPVSRQAEVPLSTYLLAGRTLSPLAERILDQLGRDKEIR